MSVAATSIGASAEALRGHYDVGTEFYRLWLDPTLTYSCPLWEDGDTLETAQMRKLDYLAESARARGARRALDVGCGWGSMLRRLVDHHGVERAVGLTISEAHARWISSWNDPRCTVLLESWEEHTPDDAYDAIVSIGAFEHFAKLGLRPAARIASYRAFFDRCRSWLRPGGRIALQTVAKGSATPDRQAIRDVIWLYTEVWPETETPRLAEIEQACEGLFDVVRCRDDGAQYARTCRLWRSRLTAQRGPAIEVAGEAVVEKFERWLDVCARLFDQGVSTLLRLELSRI
jgi:cyclopropane-fatty-acyl-phospholipid synthase